MNRNLLAVLLVILFPVCAFGFNVNLLDEYYVYDLYHKMTDMYDNVESESLSGSTYKSFSKNIIIGNAGSSLEASPFDLTTDSVGVDYSNNASGTGHAFVEGKWKFVPTSFENELIINFNGGDTWVASYVILNDITMGSELFSDTDTNGLSYYINENLTGIWNGELYDPNYWEQTNDIISPWTISHMFNPYHEYELILGTVSQSGDDWVGSYIYANMNAVSVPEPPVWMVLGISILLFWFINRKMLIHYNNEHTIVR